MFFPATGKNQKAKAFCNNCPVITQCLQSALANDEYGIWAGTTEKERAQMKAFERALLPPTPKIVKRSHFTFS